MYLLKRKNFKKKFSKVTVAGYIRNSAAYKSWRKSVVARDNNQCQRCGATNKRFAVHHIKGFEKYPSLRVDITNGITLCTYCHWKFHKIFGKKMFPNILETEYFKTAEFVVKNKIKQNEEVTDEQGQS